MLKHLLLVITLVACGDNIVARPDAVRDRHPEVDIPEDPILEPGEPAAPVDAPLTPVDSPQGPAEEDANGGCCKALLQGASVPSTCGTPPGICKNGKRKLLCGSVTFTLCN